MRRKGLALFEGGYGLVVGRDLARSDEYVDVVLGLANLDRLPAGEIYLACLPLPFIDGDGAPCRAVAWEIE